MRCQFIQTTVVVGIATIFAMAIMVIIVAIVVGVVVVVEQ